MLSFNCIFLPKSYLKCYCFVVTIEYCIDVSLVVFLNSNSLELVIVYINLALDFPTTCKCHMLSQSHQQAFEKELHFRLFMFCSEQQVPVLCQLQNRSHSKIITFAINQPFRKNRPSVSCFLLKYCHLILGKQWEEKKYRKKYLSKLIVCRRQDNVLSASLPFFLHIMLFSQGSSFLLTL